MFDGQERFNSFLLEKIYNNLKYKEGKDFKATGRSSFLNCANIWNQSQDRVTRIFDGINRESASVPATVQGVPDSVGSSSTTASHIQSPQQQQHRVVSPEKRSPEVTRPSISGFLQEV
jgi:hypothetical protein